MKTQKSRTINEYIATFPKEVQLILESLHKQIRKYAPQAEERISYNMPAFFQNGVLVYFAAYKSHIGFYPTANGIKKFEYKLRDYKYSKGTIQFPIDQPLPEKLIADIVKFRVNENNNKKRK